MESRHFQAKYIETKNFRIEYWESQNNKQTTKTILLLPPGAGTAKAFEKNIRPLASSNIRYIALTLPGRGATTTKRVFANSFDCILQCIEEFVEYLKLDHFDIYGISFGTMIIDRLLNVDYLCKRINHVCLVFPGEYFNNFVRIFLKVLFLPAKVSFINKIYHSVLSLTMKSLKFIDSQEILKQWFDTLSFKLSPSQILIPTVIYLGYDEIATKESLQEIKIKYKNSKIIQLQNSHPFANTDIQAVIGLTIPK